MSEALSTDEDKALIYREGIVYVSVCCPAWMGREDVERETNAADNDDMFPLTVSDEPYFTTGETNPCPCNGGLDRKHWLLVR